MSARPEFGLSLRLALFVPVFLLTATSAFLVLNIGVREYRQDLAAARHETQTRAEEIASDFRVLVTSAQELGETLSLLPDVLSHNPARVEPLLQKLVAQSPVYANLVLLDREGRAWASAVPLKGRAFSMADRRYFVDAMATGRFSVGEYTLGKTTGKPVLSFGYPLKDTAGILTGCIAIGFDLEYFKKAFAGSSLWPGMVFSFLDHRGTLLFRSLSPERYVGRPLPPALLDPITSGPDNGTDIGPGLDGERKIRSYAKLRLREGEAPYLYVQITAPFEPVLAGIRARVARDVGVLVVLVLPWLLLSWYMGRRFVAAPVERLKTLITQVAKGDLEIRPRSRLPTHELEEVGQALDHMLMELSESIAERKRAEAAALASEERLRLVADAAPVFLVLVDAEKRYAFANEGYAAFLGRTPEELLGKRVEDVIGPEAFRVVGPRLEQALEGNPASFETELTSPSGGRRVLSAVYTPCFGHGLDRGVVALISDVTERKAAEAEREGLHAQLRQAQKMEAIGTLAGGIAHDFNNILTPIMAHGELALMQLPEGNPVRDDIEALLSSAERAAALVKQILAISRKEEAGVPVAVNLGVLVKETARFLRASIPATIEVRIDVDPACGPVLAESTRLHQVILNLCTNASYAMAEKGGVLTMSLTRDATAGPLPRVKLAVSDTGPGIPAEVQRRIFEPYFTTKPVGKGSGLGLAVVHGIVTGLGGEIRVKSEPGRGATFEVWLPEHPAPVSWVAPAQTAPRGRGEHVLAADDEESIRSVVERLVRSLGYRVTVCASGAEALEVFRADPSGFDVVLTDYTMPGMTGLRLAAELRTLRPELPIVLGTGFSEGADEAAVAAAGLLGPVMKPYSALSLGQALREALEGGRPHP